MRRLHVSFLVVMMFCGALPSALRAATFPVERTVTFASPIDALSASLMHGEVVRLSAYVQGEWTAWQRLEIDDDVHSTESNVVIFAPPVTQVRIRGSQDVTLHPITLSHSQARTRIAATSSTNFRILSRSEWGADESLRFRVNDTSSSTRSAPETESNGSAQPSSRVTDCLEAQRNYRSEFQIRSTTKADPSGKPYLWTRQYSSEVRLIVIHHTAFLVGGDTRSPVERVRALYSYHAKSLGWGDVGYNYLIDETGQIYEGRAGGDYVVGGHAYCNNVGTMGIALLGNFEIEKPTLPQIQSLQWLTQHLSEVYKIDLNRKVTHHGKEFLWPIVGHRDVLSTTCPGYYMAGVLGQVALNVKAGTWLVGVNFPTVRTDLVEGSAETGTVEAVGPIAPDQGMIARGGTEISMPPGGTMRLTMLYRAGDKTVKAGSRIAIVALSTPDIGLMIEDGGSSVSVSSAVALSRDIRPGEQVTLSFVVSAPLTSGTYSLQIGTVRYTLQVSGRRIRAGSTPLTRGADVSQITAPRPLQYTSAPPLLPTTARASSLKSRTLQRATLRRRAQRSGQTVLTAPARRTTNGASGASIRTTLAPRTTAPTPSSETIRVALTVPSSPALRFRGTGNLGDVFIASMDSVNFSVDGSQCRAAIGSKIILGHPLRLTPDAGSLIELDDHLYRGVLECRVIDGSLTLINELPLEDYMRGLAEEPDTQPTEKQKAFAIAARSYAAHYLSSAHRKFPGMPYDASDSPALFQAYVGVTFERLNPRWLEAVEATEGRVLKVGREILRAAYFSSDDGRTRSPVEVGWVDFPFQDVFASKADPWCAGRAMAGHGVGMSGCGALGQAKDGKTAEEILEYYYPGTRIETR